MIRIVNATEPDEKMIENMGDWKLGPGLLVYLDVKQTESFLVEPGTTLRIHRPDSIFIDRVAKGVTPGGEPVALFLPNTRRHEIPTGSQVELPPFCIPFFPSAA